MDINEWRGIPWLKRNEIVRFYKIRRSGNVRMRTIAPGVDTMDEDGIAEADLFPIKNLPLEEVLAFVPLGSPLSALPLQQSVEPMAKPKKPRKKK